MQAQLEATLRLEKLLTPKLPKSVAKVETNNTYVSGTDRAEIWLRSHPDCDSMTLREIAGHVGCHQEDVRRAKKRLSKKYQ